jgi:hypothetical protein
MAIKLNEKQGAVLGRWMSWDVQAVTEDRREMNSLEDVIALTEKLEPYVVLAREIKEGEPITNVALVKETALKWMNDIQHGVGCESGRLKLIEREGDGWREMISEGESKEDAEARFRRVIDGDIEDVSLLREVFNAARDSIDDRQKAA